MKKRYTVTFDPALADLHEVLNQVEGLGVGVESSQPFIGTAVVAADAHQLELLRTIDAIKGISETSTFQTLGSNHEAEPGWTTPLFIEEDPRHPVIEPPSFAAPSQEAVVSNVVESVPDIIFETATAPAKDHPGLTRYAPEELTFDSPPQTLKAVPAGVQAAPVVLAETPHEVVDKTGGQMDEATLRQYLLTGGDFLTAAQIGALASWNDKRPDTRLNKWRRSGALFCVRHKNQDLFPVYALDPANSYQPRPEVAAILKTFEDKKDPWGVAFWFASVNGFLGGARPQDEFDTRAKEITAAAADERTSVQHG